MHSFDCIYSGFRPKETKCLLYGRNTQAVVRPQGGALLLCHKKDKKNKSIHGCLPTGVQSSLMASFCSTFTLSNMLCSPLGLSWDLENGWKVCRHTFCLLITQISLGDGIPWQDGGGVLCWKWIGLAQESQPERKTFGVLLLHQFIQNARTSYLHYSSRERKGNVNKFGLPLWLIGI